jgi:hypothetical protein
VQQHHSVRHRAHVPDSGCLLDLIEITKKIHTGRVVPSTRTNTRETAGEDVALMRPVNVVVVDDVVELRNNSLDDRAGPRRNGALKSIPSVAQPYKIAISAAKIAPPQAISKIDRPDIAVRSA